MSTDRTSLLCRSVRSLVYGGTPSTATVTLNAEAPPGGLTLNLSSNHASATVPPLGHRFGGRDQRDLPGRDDGNTRTPGEGHNLGPRRGVTKTALLYTNQPYVTGLSFSPLIVVGGSSSTGTGTLNVPAPAGGFILSLESDNGSATVPLTVTVTGVQTTATFTVETTAVLGSQVRAAHHRSGRRNLQAGTGLHQRCFGPVGG